MADEQRTERATPKRREKAREQGQLVRSRELPSALTLLSVAALLRFGQAGWISSWRDLFRNLLAVSSKPEVASITPILNSTGTSAVRLAAPPLALAWTIAAFALFLQGGFVFAPAAFQPNWSRFNPVNNLGRVFSVGGLSPMLKSLIPASFLLYIAAVIVSREWLPLIHSSQMGLSPALDWLAALLYEFAWKGGLVLLLWSVADYGMQKWNYERSLRMSKQEIRDEFKDTEGNPAIRGRIRRRRGELRRRLMMKQVTRATVIITNPDHFAVALQYIPEKMAAPIVLAKGRGLLAEKIKREARWHEIPIVENPPLARMLYRTVEIGASIPAKLYVAVAEVLAFIYRAEAQARARADADARAKNGASSKPGAASPKP
ncbi:MAG TPA: EscU/YscU/HrcU family type III secretion system export apparatus switch protein [Candidatus Acidoferrales bacterium]